MATGKTTLPGLTGIFTALSDPATLRVAIIAFAVIVASGSSRSSPAAEPSTSVVQTPRGGVRLTSSEVTSLTQALEQVRTDLSLLRVEVDRLRQEIEQLRRTDDALIARLNLLEQTATRPSPIRSAGVTLPEPSIFPFPGGCHENSKSETIRALLAVAVLAMLAWCSRWAACPPTPKATRPCKRSMR